MSDIVDQAQLTEAQTLAAALAERDRRVAEALRPATEADQADCLECGEEIDPARRKALPRVATCIDCARDFELRMRQGVVR